MLVGFCLMRRGLALEQANVVSSANHDLLVEKLLEHKMMEPPPGYQKVTMKQLELADKRFWLLLSEHTRSGSKVSAAGRPCDVHFQKCLDSTEFLTLLQHRAGGEWFSCWWGRGGSASFEAPAASWQGTRQKPKARARALRRPRCRLL